MESPKTKMFVLHFHRHRLVLLDYRCILSVIIFLQTLLDFKCVSSEPSPIMAFPPDSGSYSLFPNEDLRTGKKIRFDDDLKRERDRSIYGDRDRSPYTDRYRTYPVVFDDRYYRPGGDYNSNRPREPDTRYLDSLRTRGSRVFFDDDRNRFTSYDRYPSDNRYSDLLDHQRPSLLNRPMSPVSRPYHHHYRPDVSPGPSHSKLPIGAGDSDVRIHVYDPASNSFGNPRNSGRYPGDRSRPGNFIETGSPSPDLFINHDQYLEYHRKIAIARDLEYRKLQKALADKQQSGEEPGSKKILFAAKQPFDIAGLSPPNKGLEVESIDENQGISMKPIDVDDIGKGKIVTFTGKDGRVNLVGVADNNSENHNNSPNDEVRSGNLQNYANLKNGDQGGGSTTGPATRNSPSIVTSSISSSSSGGHAQGDEVESENAKSQVTQIPPQQLPKNFISKSGRQLSYHHIKPTALQSNSNSTVTSIAKKDEDAKKEGDEDSKKNGSGGNNGFNRKDRADGTDFQLPSRKALEHGLTSGGGAQALPLIQADTNGFVPNVPIFHPLAGAERPRAVIQLGPKAEKSELGTEVTKSRIKSKTGAKVAILKQQELKQRQKLKLKNDPRNLNQNHDQLTKTSLLSPDGYEFNEDDDTQTSSLSRPSPTIPRTNFRIPVLPANTKSSANNSPYLDNDDDSFLGLKKHEIDIDNNIVPTANGGDDGHFTLINLNNDQVDISDATGSDEDDKDIHVDDQSRPHLSGPLSSYSRNSDLDHGGDSLLQLGSTDTLVVNRTSEAKSHYLPPHNPPAASTNFIKVVRVKSLLNPANYKTTFSAINDYANGFEDANNFNSTAPTADKTLSMFMAKRMDSSSKKNKKTVSMTMSKSKGAGGGGISKGSLKSGVKSGNHLTESTESESEGSQNSNGTVVTDPLIEVKATIMPKGSLSLSSGTTSTHQMSMSRGVIAMVHAHVSHCPKLHAPAEIICDIHIRESHGHPNPQLTVGWRRKFYNSSQPDVLLVLNKTQIYDDADDENDKEDAQGEKGNRSTTASTTTTTTMRTSVIAPDQGDSAKNESLEDFHDKFNVTLAPGINPMLRSVLLIRGVTAPDCGSYQCSVSDSHGYTLTSETLLFLCH